MATPVPALSTRSARAGTALHSNNKAVKTARIQRILEIIQGLSSLPDRFAKASIAWFGKLIGSQGRRHLKCWRKVGGINGFSDRLDTARAARGAGGLFGLGSGCVRFLCLGFRAERCRQGFSGRQFR